MVKMLFLQWRYSLFTNSEQWVINEYDSQMMKTQFVSDLHLEFPQNRAWLAKHPLEVNGDILLVAGATAYLDLPDSGHDTYTKVIVNGYGQKAPRLEVSCQINR